MTTRKSLQTAAVSAVEESLWNEVLAHVRAHHPAISRGWFCDLRPGPMDAGEFTIFADNRGQLTYLAEHCARPFMLAAQAATGRLVAVCFATADGEIATPTPERVGVNVPSFERENALLRLNADYVFHNYVEGPCNRLAHASCIAVSQSPGTVFNPLFLHGGVGLGKTHLLQAICHALLDRQPDAKVCYLSCETFVNHFIEAVEKGALDGFRRIYRQLDLLLIDDAQFLAGKERTQEEFFHTFNAMYQEHKQIVLSADCPPSSIAGLEERLVSRFNWGLVTRIDPPCPETRLAIIRKKAKMRGMEIPDDVATFMATRIRSNTRELEGALNRIHGAHSLEGRVIDVTVARECLGDVEPVVRRQIRIQDILAAVTERFDVKVSDLQGRRRSRSIAFPRQVGMYLARRYTHHSLEEIGGFFGGRDHTTVLHANKLVSKRRERDVAFRSRLEEIGASLEQG